ncbi:hypothetical protein Poras_0373 [Porphyromonas asaccharolytica DSM 20707]|uniref:Uncharacterized protein n=1 Tax=Porphyromonas asaccharolytica (strain ATCC 25260 / DSM 20707 / BCRC 10618 / CCUG 7834 / JCM 6326 / LMG 13178 / VPI 4198 / B440) TaxID=879243 RepID=F4KMS6_PORAD|nr:hypothetical protein Poras_0373 [Porphyromonas asaccharolytica DSM 20707]
MPWRGAGWPAVPLDLLLPLVGEYTIYRYISEYLSPQKNLSTLLVAVYPSSLKSRAHLARECNLNLVTTFVPVVLFG